MDPQQHRVIRPQPGNLRDPRCFVGREAVTSRARERLSVGANLLLTDFRRMGKTYWMRTFADRETAFRSYFVDYEGTDTTSGFLDKTAKHLAENPKLPERMRKHLATIFDHVDSVGVPGYLTLKPYHTTTPPLILLEDILKRLDVRDDEDTIPLVLMDEVPMAVALIAEKEGATAAKRLLQTLRGLRQNTTRVRWIVTGSVGFHHVIRQAGTTSGDINDLEPLHLGPMPEQESQELAQALFRGIHQVPSDGVVDELIDVSGGIPAIMHQVLTIVDLHGHDAPGPDDIREAFEDVIDDPHAFASFRHFAERVREYYGPLTVEAEQILDITSRSAPGAWVAVADLPQGDELRNTMDLLCQDHYLERHGGRVRWRYPAFAYIWSRSRNLRERP